MRYYEDEKVELVDVDSVNFIALNRGFPAKSSSFQAAVIAPRPENIKIDNFEAAVEQQSMMSNQAADFDSAEEQDDFAIVSTKHFQSNPRKKLVDQLADTMTTPRQQKQIKINREQATISLSLINIEGHKQKLADRLNVLFFELKISKNSISKLAQDYAIFCSAMTAADKKARMAKEKINEVSDLLESSMAQLELLTEW